MRPHSSAPRLLASALLLLGALAACHDGITTPGASRPLSRPNEARRLAELECRADLLAGTVSCGTAASAGAARGDLVVGGQGVFVKLVSSNVATTDVPDVAERDTFAFDVTVQNLIPQALATADGTTAEASGVRVFFTNEPKATGGSGTVAVGNADGYDTFTGVNQAFFQYAGLLDTNATTAARRWKLAFDPGVTAIAFRVYVSSVVQYPDGWVEVGYGTLTPQMAPGATGRPAATVRDVVGQVVSEPVTYLASTSAFSVSGGDVTAGPCGSGPTVISGSTATRPARLGIAVRVATPAFSAFSPDPYSAAGNAISPTADLSASFAYCTVAAGPGTFVVHGAQGSPALLGGSYTGAGTSTATYHHTAGFFPGEEVEATLTSELATQARVVRFRTAAGAASGTFTGPPVTGAGPRSVAIGDFNGDGRQDMAVANSGTGANTVSVLLRNAANTGFDTRTDYATGSTPYSVAIGDLNGDGRPDIAVANQGAASVSVLMRNAANTGFDAKVDYAAGTNSRYVAIGDLNGDGHPDLAVANYQVNTVSVLLRNATNTGFDAKVDVATGVGPASVAIGDLNGDGRQDVLTANLGAGTVSVLLRNTGNTGFSAKVDYSIGSTPTSVAIGDLNGDGRMDIASAGGSFVSVMLRNAANTGYAAVSTVLTGAGSQSVALGDLNGDGRVDLAVATSTLNGVAVVLRTADNTGFEDKVDYGAGPTPVFAAIGDLNGDGRLDLAVANSGAAFVSVLARNDANTGFLAENVAEYATGTIPDGVAAGDLDGDGRLDLAVANQSSNTVSVLFRNAANTGFEARVDYAIGSGPFAVAIGDLDGDGRLDLAVTNNNDATVSVLLRNAANTDFAAPVDYATGAAPQSVAIGDLNGDGRLDLAVGNISGNTISVLLRSADGSGFATAVDYATGSGPRSVAIGDLNGDGRMDLAVANINASTASVLLRNATNTGFAAKVDYATGAGPLSLAIGDLNGDGRPDLAVANTSSNVASVLLRNAGNSGFDPKVDYPVGATRNGNSALAIGDLNGDGRLDIAVGGANSVVSVLLRNAAGTGFDPRVDYAATSAYGLAMADLDGDGRLDLAIASRTTNVATVLLNQP